MASYKALPGEIASLEELHSYWEQPSYYVDLESVLTGNQKQQFEVSENKVSSKGFSVGVYVVGVKDAAIAYTLQARVDPLFCPWDCPGGKCRDGRCSCDHGFTGRECQIAA